MPKPVQNLKPEIQTANALIIAGACKQELERKLVHIGASERKLVHIVALEEACYLNAYDQKALCLHGPSSQH